MGSRLAILALLVLLIPGSVRAEPMVVDVIGLPFWAYRNPDRSGEGVLFPMSRAVAERAGLEISLVSHPLARFRERILKRIPAWSIFLRTPWSAKTVVPVALVLDDVDSVLIPRRGVEVSDLDKVDGLRVAMPRGLELGQKLNDNPGIVRVMTSDYAQSMLLVAAGRADAAAGIRRALLFAANSAGIAPDRFGRPLVLGKASMWLHYIGARKDTALIERLRSATDALRDEGVFERMADAFVAGAGK